MKWIETDKGDPRCRALADRHYTRKSIGHPMFTRPGYNQVLYAEQKNGKSACFVWWRPKWESGLPGTKRKDGLYCIECTIFRNETSWLSSNLIIDAIKVLQSWKRFLDVDCPDGIITGVSSSKTSNGRAPSSPPGMCFLAAGFSPFSHPGKNVRADVWLKFSESLPTIHFPERSKRLIDREP